MRVILFFIILLSCLFAMSSSSARMMLDINLDVEPVTSSVSGPGSGSMLWSTGGDIVLWSTGGDGIDWE